MTSTLEQEHLTTRSSTNFIQSPQDFNITWPIVYLVSINFLQCLGVLVSIFGIISNTCNVIICKQLLVSDSLAPTILLLALIDGSICTIHVLKFCFIGNSYCLAFDLDNLVATNESFDYIINEFFIVSNLIVLNACVRVCLGVISSFRIDKVFIRKRLRVSNVLIIVFTTVCFMPVWIIKGMSRKNYDPYLNETSLDSQFATEYHGATLFTFVVGNILVPMFVLIVSIWSIVIQSMVFKRSARLRQKHTIEALEPSDLAKFDEMSKKIILYKQGRGQKPDTKVNMLSNRYIKLVKMVTMLAAMCCVYSLPTCVPAIVTLLNPDYNSRKMSQVMTICKTMLIEDVALISVSIKMFCYRFVNAKFKQALRSLIKTRIC